MKGYLMVDREWVPGEDLFLESVSPENQFAVVLEYDGETLYFYAVERDMEGPGMRVLDALHIWQRQQDGGREEPNGRTEEPDEGREEANERPVRLQVFWSRDWQKCALVIDGRCHAAFDLEAHGGYNINEFPPPNEHWTHGDRKLTDEIIDRLF
ncbi:MAG TPA: DUF2251 domain-containing protein [Puia sp.]|jgi:hypothetical protein|nr:DUF2251 domain-containing protein [Puia sp.]